MILISMGCSRSWRVSARDLPASRRLDVDAIASTVASMKPDEEREWSFEVVHGDTHISLQARVFTDDVDAPDLYVITSADLANQIQNEMIAFAEERGQRFSISSGARRSRHEA